MTHHVGRCITCKDPVSFQSVLPHDQQCVECQYAANSRSNRRKCCNDKPWDFFAGWPDRPLDKKEAAHAAKLLRWLVLRTSVSGEGRLLKLSFLPKSGCFSLES